MRFVVVLRVASDHLHVILRTQPKDRIWTVRALNEARYFVFLDGRHSYQCVGVYVQICMSCPIVFSVSEPHRQSLWHQSMCFIHRRSHAHTRTHARTHARIPRWGIYAWQSVTESYMPQNRRARQCRLPAHNTMRTYPSGPANGFGRTGGASTQASGTRFAAESCPCEEEGCHVEGR